MIITCENCSKKFSIQDNLIPDEGRQLQCGSCNHKWFFKKNNKTIKLENETFQNQPEDNSSGVSDNVQKKIKKKTEKIIDIENEKSENFNKLKKTKKNPKIIKNSLVFVISLISIIVLLDTFKIQLNNYLPGLDSILNNLYESLKDLLLFFKDLIN